MLALQFLRNSWKSEEQMAEFIRKKRFFKYRDKRCKKFLSRDFVKKCAYCKIREGDLAGPDSFEKDHFIPVSNGGNDEYDNLYYACASCNGKAGKWDFWSKTLLDPCRDDIWGIHISLSDDFIYKKITEQGDEYIKTFKLNRKSYVIQRRVIAEHQMELQEKLKQYLILCDAVAGGVEVKRILEKDIKDIESVIKYGANYRMSENAFDEDIDKLIYESLSKAGKVECVDRDYDLFYQLEIGNNKYLCYIDIDEIEFNISGKAKRYISTEKLKIWKEIEAAEEILIITFNETDRNVYFTRMKDILQLKGVDNLEKCGYDLLQSNRVEKLK